MRVLKKFLIANGIIIALAGSFSVSSYATTATNGQMPDDGTLTIKWTATVGGSSCGGFPAKIMRLDSSTSATGSFSVPSGTCCPFPNDMYSCNSIHDYSGAPIGTTPGIPTPSSCAGGATPTPNPGTMDVAVYENTAGGCAGNGCSDTYPNYTGSEQQVLYLRKGQTWAVNTHIGFKNHQGADCGGGLVGYCYTNHNFLISNSVATAQNCGQWVPTTIKDCGFSTLIFWTKWEPNSGCTPPPPVAGPPTKPTIGTLAMNPTQKSWTLTGTAKVTDPLTITITNNTGLNLDGCVVSSSDPANFNLVSTSGCTTLPKNGSCGAVYQGAPTQPGPHTSTLNVNCASSTM